MCEWTLSLPQADKECLFKEQVEKKKCMWKCETHKDAAASTNK